MQREELPIHKKGLQLQNPHPFELGAVRRFFALPVTFTPFASVKPCSARCIFCSETLKPVDNRILSASLRPGPRYFQGLEKVLSMLGGLPLGFSLSGLESTDDPKWLFQVLDRLQSFAEQGGRVSERVLYTNGAGFCSPGTGEDLVARLQEFSLTRVELSRHHYQENKNNQIMRFRAGQAIGGQSSFERVVGKIQASLPLRLVCLIQKNGIQNLEGIRCYLKWAESLGIRDVVFREFSRMGENYKPNRTFERIEAGRVFLEELLNQVWPSGAGPVSDFHPLEITAGYYYWNLSMVWQKRVKVTFETSDYREMKQRHRSAVVHKLIYHANGNLCADWDPEKQVLLRTAEV